MNKDLQDFFVFIIATFIVVYIITWTIDYFFNIQPTKLNTNTLPTKPNNTTEI